jgi:hypothetical protein
MNNLFEKYPVIAYDNKVATNILTRIQFDKTLIKDTQLFHPYTIRDGQRADVLAHDYYGDSRYVWLIYLSNSIIDPYFNWPLTDEQFRKYLIKKYGSVEKSQNKVAFYRIDYENDDRILSPSLFDQLPKSLKKYWKPIFGEINTISGYERNDSSEARETNKVIYLNVDDTSIFAVEDKVTTTSEYTQINIVTNSSVFLDEIITQGDATGRIIYNFNTDSSPKSLLIKTISGSFQSNSTNVTSNSIGTATILSVSQSSLTSEGTVKSISGNTLVVQHVSGKFYSDYGYLSYEEEAGRGPLHTELGLEITTEQSSNRLYKKNTEQFAYLTETVNEVNDEFGKAINVSITDLEYIYWTPVSCFTYETELNDSRKFIYLLDSSYLNKIEKEIADLI